jgi:secreted trypsin-like serine protease
MTLPSWSLALGMATLMTGCSGDPSSPLAQSGEAVIGGSYDLGDPAAVYVYVLGPNNTYGAGTGTIVSPHVVVTAAHVVNVFAGFASPSYRIFIDSDKPANGSVASNWLSVREAHVDPAYNPSSRTHDVGVLILDEATRIPPIPLLRRAADATWLGRSIRSIGYGGTSTSDVTASSGGTRTQGTATISSVSQFFFGSTVGNLPCHGDSGGPGLVTVDDQEVLAGVVSNGNAACTGGAFARVELSLAFVDGWIARVDPASADAGTDPDAPPDEGTASADSDTGGPGPDPDALDDATAEMVDGAAGEAARAPGCSIARGATPASAWMTLVLLAAAVSRRDRPNPRQRSAPRSTGSPKDRSTARSR